MDSEKLLNNLFYLSVGLLVGSLVIHLLTLPIWLIEFPYSLQFKIHGYTEENVLAICSGKKLVNTAFCLNSFVRGIYKYVPTDDLPSVNLEDIKQYGEDCHGYTILYNKLAENFGFKTKKVIVSINKTTAHSFSLIYNEEGYCKLDLRNIDCISYT